MYVNLFYNTTNFNLQLHWLYTYTLYGQRYTQGVSMFLYYNYTQRAYSKPMDTQHEGSELEMSVAWIVLMFTVPKLKFVVSTAY
jgi:hypothetical protein